MASQHYNQEYAEEGEFEEEAVVPSGMSKWAKITLGAVITSAIFGLLGFLFYEFILKKPKDATIPDDAASTNKTTPSTNSPATNKAAANSVTPSPPPTVTPSPPPTVAPALPPALVVPTSAVYISPVSAPGMTIDVMGANDADGAVVFMYEKHGNVNQQWRYEPNTGMIRSHMNENRCLDVPVGNTSARQLTIWECGANNTNQIFSIDPASQNITHVASGLVLDAENGGSINGQALRLAPKNGQNNQKWSLNSP
jgi:hypothetical protein